MGALFTLIAVFMFAWASFSCAFAGMTVLSYVYLIVSFLCVGIFTLIFRLLFRTVDMTMLYMYNILYMLSFCLNFGADPAGDKLLTCLSDYGIAMASFLIMFVIIRYTGLFNSGWLALIAAIISIAMLLAARIFGGVTNGTYNWIGPIQPSEYIKLAIPIITAWCLKPNVGSKLKIIGKSSIIPMRHFGYLAFMTVIIGLMGAVNREFGTAMIIAGTMVICFLCMSSSWFWKIILSAAGALISFVLIIVVDLLQGRVLIWLDPLGEGAKLDNAEVFVKFFRLINTTGWYGGGLTQAATANVRERYSDFAFMSAVQTGGVLTGIMITGIFIIMLIYGIKIASHQKEQESLLVFSALCIFSLTALIHIGGNLTSLPLTGICLPALSNGTQAAICNAGLVAMIMAFSGRKVREVNANT